MMEKHCSNPLNKPRHSLLRKMIGIQCIPAKLFEQCKMQLTDYQWNENMQICTRCHIDITSMIETFPNVSPNKATERMKLDSTSYLSSMDDDCDDIGIPETSDRNFTPVKGKENTGKEKVSHMCIICATEFKQNKPRSIQEFSAKGNTQTSLSKKILDEYSIFFALNNCIGVSLQSCEDLFSQLIKKYGEPGHWEVSFCPQHAGIVEEASKIHRLVLQLETKREKLTKKLKSDVAESLKRCVEAEYSHPSKAFQRIRDTIQDVVLPKPNKRIARVRSEKVQKIQSEDCGNLSTPTSMNYILDEPETLPEIDEIKVEIDDSINEEITAHSFNWGDALSVKDDEIPTDNENDNFDDFEPCDIVPTSESSTCTDSALTTEELSAQSKAGDGNDNSADKRTKKLDLHNKKAENTSVIRRNKKISRIKYLPEVNRSVKRAKNSATGLKSECRFGCRVCNERFITAEIRDKHQTLVHGPGKHFPCTTCGINFSTLCTLTYHIARKHSTHKMFACDLCSHTFPFQGDLNKHKRTIHALEVLKCPQCGKEFKGKHKLYQHTRQVHVAKEMKPKKRILTCEFCEKTYRSPQEFKKHQAKEHLANYEPAVCDECGKTLSDPRSLRKHKQAIHLKDYKHQCSICNYKCLFKSLLESHMQSAHGDGVKSGTKSAKKVKS